MIGEHQEIAPLLKEFTDTLEGNDAAFLERVYSRGIAPYAERLKQYGFCGLTHVLDAGCGFGQWTLALSILNSRVSACDASQRRVEILSRLAVELGAGDLSVRQASLEALPYESASFDGVFCYGVLFLTRWSETLRELARVLRPGGRLYVNANGFGWYKHLWHDLPNPAPDYDPRLLAARAFMNTWKYENGQVSEEGVDIIIEPDALKQELEKLGFDDVEQASEGVLFAADPHQAAQQAFFPGEYSGDLGVYEVIALKNGHQHPSQGDRV
jgi:ubiquinone/menaquinone biosynthesis C-methylase UbiE